MTNFRYQNRAVDRHSALKQVANNMSMHLEIRPEAGFLHVSATGKFSLKEAEQTFLEILEAVILHTTSKVMIDGRKLIGKPENIERFCYGKFAANSVKAYRARGVSPATAFAYVLKEPVLDPQRFGETVAVNRGMLVKAFDNLENAFAWLKIERTNKPETHDRP